MDHSPLVGPACQILEGELTRLLATPARAVAEPLALLSQKEPAASRFRDLLQKWATGELPPTLGLQQILLQALRLGLRKGDDQVCAFLDFHFGPRYGYLLLDERFGRFLDRVRTQFRNPAAHGMATMSHAQYAEFTGLMVGNRCLADWYREGNEQLDPGPEIALLDHHLAESRL
jgi:hypothetical protein